ncbi:hypothetical protein BH23ACT8_BH23ACT8_24810 [soil metagenome]
MGSARSGKGWEAVTERAIVALSARRRPLVAILWGSDARNLKPLLGGVPVVESPHPSPHTPPTPPPPRGGGVETALAAQCQPPQRPRP